MGYDPRYALYRKRAFADLFVAVLVGADRIFRIVEMDRLEPVKPYHAVKLRQHPIGIAGNVVSAVAYVAGVKAYPDMIADVSFTMAMIERISSNVTPISVPCRSSSL